MIREDFIERTIQQLVQAVARLLGIVKEGRNDLARQQLDQMWRDWLGLPREAFAMLTPESAAEILGARAPIAIELLKAEAELRRAEGLPGDAEDIERRLAALERALAAESSSRLA